MSSINMYSNHLSAQSIRTALAPREGLASSTKFPKRIPAQTVLADQHCTHFMRESCDSCGILRRSDKLRVCGFSTSPEIFSLYLLMSIGGTGLYHIRRNLCSSGVSLGSRSSGLFCAAN